MMEELKRVPPPVFPVEDINLPEISFSRLENGIPVYLIEAGTEDVIRMEFTFHAGQVKDELPMLASTTNAMLSEGSQNYTSEELHRILDYYGAFLHMNMDKDRAGIIVFSLSKHIRKVLELCLDILFRPVFPKSELDTLMRKRLQWFRINREKVQNLAYDCFFESVFGTQHPYGHQPVEEDFGKLYPSALTDFHEKYYTPGNMAIIISGKIPEKTLDLLNDFFGNLLSKNIYTEDLKGNPKGEGKKKFFIEKSGTVQSAVRIGSATINKRHADYQGLKVLDSILGGYFGSRLMRNIREDKGYTYGIRSVVSSLDLSGYKVISTEVGNENCRKAIDEIYKEIRLLQEEPVGKEEMEVVKNYMAGEMLRMFDGPFAIAESFKSVWEFGLDNSYFYSLANKIKTINPDEIKSLAIKYYNIDDLYEIIAGSK